MIRNACLDNLRKMPVGTAEGLTCFAHRLVYMLVPRLKENRSTNKYLEVLLTHGDSLFCPDFTAGRIIAGFTGGIEWFVAKHA